MASASWTDLPADVLAVLRRGAVLPAHPLALDEARKFDRQSQRALSRYYIDAGAGGLAVGVHATQFQIRDVGLYRPVLELAAETASSWAKRPLIMIAGAIGKTAQAVDEARTARSLGYHAVLLGLGAMKGASEDEIVEHCATVAREMPLIGFYLQTAVGGIALSRAFWTRFAAIENVIAIKVAPFDRYKTLDVAFGVVAAGAEERVTLYTGNDDHIVADLVTPLRIRTGRREAIRALPRRPAGPLERVDEIGRRPAGQDSRLRRQRCRARRDPGARCHGDRLQQRHLRRRQRLCRLHSRLPRGAAPPGPHAHGPLPRPQGGHEPRPGRRHRPPLRQLPRAHRRRFVRANLERWRE